MVLDGWSDGWCSRVAGGCWRFFWEAVGWKTTGKLRIKDSGAGWPRRVAGARHSLWTVAREWLEGSWENDL